MVEMGTKERLVEMRRALFPAQFLVVIMETTTSRQRVEMVKRAVMEEMARKVDEVEREELAGMGLLVVTESITFMEKAGKVVRVELGEPGVMGRKEEWAETPEMERV